MSPSSKLFTIAGYRGCGFFYRAVSDGRALASAVPGVSISELEFDRDGYFSFLGTALKGRSISHRTSPAVFEGNPLEDKSAPLIGGASEFNQYIAKNYPDV
mmetsp:Transcript_17640/g.29973  ORF Transcript_17640/g.29973 Transcript_17640/m.29973 type:complete len:101 (+) Transcript_17640:775-1077(+)